MKASARERDILSFSIRISDNLHGEIKQEAEQINSSLNSFMMVLLKLGLKTYQGKIIVQVERE